MINEDKTDVQKFIKLSKYSDRNYAKSLVAFKTESLIAETGWGWDLKRADLCGLNLEGFDLRCANFTEAQLHGTILKQADLSGARFICSGMHHTNFEGANLRGVYMHAQAAQVCNFENADLSLIADATGALFHGCKMRGMKACNSNFTDSVFFQCIMEKNVLCGAILNEATFNDCRMRGSNMRHITAHGVNFTNCDVTESDISDAQLYRARFMGKHAASMGMRGVNFTNSVLVQADMFADLSGADFTRAYLAYARLNLCLLEKTKFIGADMHNTSMLKVDKNEPAVTGARTLSHNFDDRAFRPE